MSERAVAAASPPRSRRRNSAVRRWARVALVAGALLAGAASAADNLLEAASCPGREKSPVMFRIDCSHVRDAAARAQCLPFITNQSCRVFPAYRKITGINLEGACPTITYTIYDKAEWPYPGGDAGGYAAKCSAKLMSEFSVLRKTALGPLDTHELLHVYQSELGALPSSHILFGSTQLEALREMGDRYGYESGFARLKGETLGPSFEQYFASDRMKPEGRCAAAQTNLEARLYIGNPKAVYDFWRQLERASLKQQADREARFNRMFERVGGPSARAFLVAHGCSGW